MGCRGNCRGRKREPRTRRVLARVVLWLADRRAMRIETDRRGRVSWHWLCDPSKLFTADRMRAAVALREFLPRLTQDESYDLLFPPPKGR